MESSWKKPEAKMVKPKRHAPDSQEAESAAEAAELAADQARLAKSKEDQVGALIGGKWFITNWTDPILMHPHLGLQMTVTRFYPETNVAIDIFPFMGDAQRAEIELKRAAFKLRKATYGGQYVQVKYAALDYAMPLANLLPQLEAN